MEESNAQKQCFIHYTNRRPSRELPLEAPYFVYRVPKVTNASFFNPPIKVKNRLNQTLTKASLLVLQVKKWGFNGVESLGFRCFLTRRLITYLQILGFKCSWLARFVIINFGMSQSSDSSSELPPRPTGEGQVQAEQPPISQQRSTLEPPNLQEYKLYVSGLSRKAKSQDLRMKFREFGEIKDAFIVAPKQSLAVSRNQVPFGFVQYYEKKHAEEALLATNGTSINGSRITVEWAKPRIRPGRNSRPGSANKNKARETTCYRCNKVGHFAKECTNSAPRETSVDDSKRRAQNNKNKKRGRRMRSESQSDASKKKKRRRSESSSESSSKDRKKGKKGTHSRKAEPKRKRKRESSSSSSDSSSSSSGYDRRGGKKHSRSRNLDPKNGKKKNTRSSSSS